jgi:hypothetical protein
LKGRPARNGAIAASCDDQGISGSKTIEDQPDLDAALQICAVFRLREEGRYLLEVFSISSV